jgi:arylsulfatase
VTASDSRPNVILIMADQWRGDCLSVAGHPVVQTPFLDGIAERGARFSRAYSASPTCTPARASLHTGTKPTTHGRVGYEDYVPWDYAVTLAGEFTRHGYQTQAVGKMHVYPERSQLGFQNVILHSPLGIVRMKRQHGGDPDLVDDYLPWLRQQLGRDATFFDHGLDSNSYVARPWDKPEHTHPTNFVAGQAADFLRRRDPRKPFFLFTSFNAPHPPYDPPAWAFEQYLDQPMPDPPVGDWTDAYDEYASSHDPISFVGDVDQRLLQRARAGYYGHMTHVDQQISFLMETLDHHGLAENTYVCFLADHGEMLGDHNMFRKGFPYEGSARIPMLLAGPDDGGINSGLISDRLVELRDVMPTLLDCAELPILEAVEGRSFLPLARGEDTPWRDVLHGEHVSLGQSMQWMTDGREKYVWLSGSGLEQLFNLDHDPEERHNLATDPSAHARLSRWRAALISELRDREEGFTNGEQLLAGRPVNPSLKHLRRSAGPD